VKYDGDFDETPRTNKGSLDLNSPALNDEVFHFMLWVNGLQSVEPLVWSLLEFGLMVCTLQLNLLLSEIGDRFNFI